MLNQLQQSTSDGEQLNGSAVVEQPGPIFVVGVPRSGTTLLRLLLNAHSKIAIGPETHFFKQVWALREKYGDLAKHENLQALWSDYTGEKSFEDFRFEDISSVEETIFSSSKSYAGLLKDLLTLYAQREGKLIWGEKTPEHLFNVEEILEWYPTARIVHVIRDPRAVCSSLTKVPWSSDDLISNARVWNRYLEHAEQLKGKPGIASRMLEVLYEDLIANTEDTLIRICEFLDLEFETQMLEFHQQSSQYVEKDEPWKNNALSPLNTSSINKWKQEITATQRSELEAVSRKHMIQHGYLKASECSGTTAFYTTLFKAKLKWALRRFRFHTTKRIFSNP